MVAGGGLSTAFPHFMVYLLQQSLPVVGHIAATFEVTPTARRIFYLLNHHCDTSMRLSPNTVVPALGI